MTIVEKFSKNLLKKNKGVPFQISQPKKIQNLIVQSYLRQKNLYSRELNKNMRELMSGNISKNEFMKRGKALISGVFSESYRLGKYYGSGKYAPMDDTERRFVVNQTTKELNFLDNFATDMVNGSGTMPYKRRAKMYVDSLDAMFGFGRLVYVPEDVKIIWRLGSNDRHCPDCIVFASNNPYTKRTLPGYPKSGASRCFVGSPNWYKVLTPDGWKKINGVEIGELVLTHKGKWKHVIGKINTECEDEYCYEVSLKTKAKRPLKFYMLNDHLSIVDGRWVRADELKVNDRLLMIGHKCKQCGKLIKYDDQRAINFEFCSVSCSNKGSGDKWSNGRKKLIEKHGELGHALKEWRSSPENIQFSKEVGKQALDKVHKSRIGKTYEELYGKEKADSLRIKCTKTAHAITKKLISEGKHIFQLLAKSRTKEERSEFSKQARACLSHEEFLTLYENHINNLIQSGNFKFTKPERMMLEILEELGFKWTTQKRLGNFFYDFYLTDYNIYIEVDGDFIHGNPKFYVEDSLKKIQQKQKIKDLKKDETVKEHGSILLRFWEDDIKSSPELVKNKLKLVMHNHNGEFHGYYKEIIDIKKVKVSDLIARRVVSLTVEDHESYVTNSGLIAHNCLANCYCSLIYYYNNTTLNSEYDAFLLSGKEFNVNKELPTEEQYVGLMNIRNEYYFNRLMYEKTKDVRYANYAKELKREFYGQIRGNNLYFPVDFNVKQAVVDFKLFNKNNKFKFVEDHADISDGDFLCVFFGPSQKYVKVTKKIGSEIFVKTLDSFEYTISPSKNVIFKEV